MLEMSKRLPNISCTLTAFGVGMLAQFSKFCAIMALASRHIGGA